MNKFFVTYCRQNQAPQAEHVSTVNYNTSESNGKTKAEFELEIKNLSADLDEQKREYCDKVQKLEEEMRAILERQSILTENHESLKRYAFASSFAVLSCRKFYQPQLANVYINCFEFQRT